VGDINTGGGANVGKDVSAGNDYVGRDKHNVGDGAVYGSNVNIHQNEQPIDDFTDRELLRKISIALLGDPYNRRGNPGLVDTVDELLDKFASLVSANAAQSVRLDVADKERKLLTENQQALIETQRRFQRDSQKRFDSIDSSQDNARISIWLIAFFLIGEGAYLVYLSIKISAGG
jgi:hypothetical protein